MDNSRRGVNQENIQSMNRTLILNLLREQGVCSRAFLAKASGLKKATVTYIINDFISWGCVKEVGLMSGDKGRRSIGITIADDKFYVIGIRLARRYFKVGLFSINGELKTVKEREIKRHEDPQVIMEDILDNVAHLIKTTAEGKILAIGMAIPGPLIKEKSRIAILTESASWGNMLFKDELERRFSYPVFIEHDANAGAFAQLWYDKSIDNKSLIYVALGQGVGAGIVCDGKILKGELGIAGEIGHTSISFDGPACECGNRGCLEKYCSSIALARQIAERKGKETSFSLTEIKKMIEQKDEDALHELKQAYRYLGYGLVNVVNSFNPSVIILGDEMSHIDDEIMLTEVGNVLRERLLQEVYSCLSIKISKVVLDSVLHGIGAICVNEVLGNLECYMEK